MSTASPGSLSITAESRGNISANCRIESAPRFRDSHCCVFTTGSYFDCQLYLATSAVRLNTDLGMSQIEQHRYGIEWLGKMLMRGDRSWIELAKMLPAADNDHLSGLVGRAGTLEQIRISRLK